MNTAVVLNSRDLYRAMVISQRVENDFVTGLQVAKIILYSLANYHCSVQISAV